MSQPTGLLASERRDEIARRVHARGYQSVLELVADLGVSDMTVRRDLRRLAQDGLVSVVHGGASIPAGGAPPGFVVRETIELTAKRAIAQVAARQIGDDSTVLMDAGTTVYEVAVALSHDFRGHVITHSVPILNHLLDRPEVQVLGLGGDLRSESRALLGPTTVDMLQQVRAATLVLGATAISSSAVFAAHEMERATKASMIERAEQVIVVADHTKISTRAPLVVADWGQVDLLVTDRPLPRDVDAACRASGVQVMIAEPPLTLAMRDFQ